VQNPTPYSPCTVHVYYKVLAAQWDESGTKGLRGGELIWPKTALHISYVFIAILSLMKHVKTFYGRYLPKEAFFRQFYWIINILK
jgi:hypothetical protein